MQNLTSVMAGHKNPVEMLRNSQVGMYVYPVVAPEFSNWRSEQAAWRHSAVLFDQTHHMDELTVEGPQAAEFLSHTGINSFANFDLNRAKHFVPVTPAGHVIGDMIIFREREDKFILVGRAPTANWLLFQSAIGDWQVRLFHNPRSDSRPDGERVLRTHYRFQIQGPDADKIFAKVNGGPVPDIPFFHVDWISIGSRKVQALRHGMAGAPGLELWGPYADKHYIRSTLLQAARDSRVDLVPGVATASEVMLGRDYGITCFKLFPAVAAGGIALLKSLAGPFPDRPGSSDVLPADPENEAGNRQ